MGRKYGTSLDKHICMSSCFKNSCNVEKRRDKTHKLGLFFNIRHALRTRGSSAGTWETTCLLL